MKVCINYPQKSALFQIWLRPPYPRKWGKKLTEVKYNNNDEANRHRNTDIFSNNNNLL